MNEIEKGREKVSGKGLVLEINVYSDVICPWCYVGKRRLERALQQWDSAVPVKISWRPFQLNPTMPQRGMDRRQYLEAKFEAKFGGPAAAQAIYSQVFIAGAEEGIPFAFEKISRTPNTFAAHRLIWWAGHQGKQDRIVETLFRRYFIEGREIGSVEALSQAAADAGLERAAIDAFLVSDEGVEAVKAEEAAGRRLGIGGVPYFVLNGTYALSGAQPPEQFLTVFRQIEAASAVGKAGT